MTRFALFGIFFSFFAVPASATGCRIIYADGTVGECKVNIANGWAIVVPTKPNPVPKTRAELEKEWLPLDRIEGMLEQLNEK